MSEKEDFSNCGLQQNEIWWNLLKPNQLQDAKGKKQMKMDILTQVISMCQ